MTRYRSVAVLLAALLLGACGGSPAAPSPTVEPLVSRQNPASAEEDLPAPTRAQVVPPTLLPTLVATAPPAVAQDALPELTRQGYATLALLRGLAGRLGDLARQAQAAPETPTQGADGALGQRIALAALFNTIEDRLAQEAPDPALAGAWDSARAAVPRLKDVLTSWNDGRLTAQEAAAKLAPIQAELDQMLAAADERLGGSYGLDAERLRTLAGDALERLRAALQPTPTP